jgi:HEAT repeat protein
MSRKPLLIALCIAGALFTGILVTVAMNGMHEMPSLVQIQYAIQGIDDRLDRMESSFDARLQELEREIQEDRRGSLPSPARKGGGGDGPDAEDEERQDAGETPASSDALARVLGRLEDLEMRIQGLEEDPIDRAYAFLRSKNFELRRQGLSTLERIARFDPQAREAIRQMMGDPDPRVRQLAIDTLGDIEDKESATSIAALLSDSSIDVRREAISALARLGAKEQGGEIAALLQDAEPGVREQAADVLGQLGYPGASAALIQALSDPNDGVRGQAIASLGETGAKDAIPYLRELYETDPGRNRIRVVRALRSLGDPGPYEAEIRRLTQAATGDPSEGVRRESLRTLGWLAEDRAKPIFQQALQDPSEQVRREAERYLRERR